MSPSRRSSTFSDVPGHTTKKDFAGVNRILVVPGGQLTAPSERGFIHSWSEKQEEGISQGLVISEDQKGKFSEL